MWYLGEVGETPIGRLFVALDEDGLRLVTWAEDLQDARRAALRRGAEEVTASAVRTADAVAQLREYFSGQRRVFTLPISWAGLTPFQRRVLQETMRIPYGETRTYGELAAAIGRPGAARAVGQAEGANPMPIVVPCHRVLGARGRLTGYGGGQGLDTKRWLLRHEGVIHFSANHLGRESR